MRRHLALAGASAAALALLAGPATAQSADQTIEATLSDAISVSLTEPSITETLVVGTNNFGGGQLQIDANVLTTVSVAFDKTAMTAYDAGAYDDSTQLSSALTMTATEAGTSTVAGTATSGTDGVLLTTELLGTSTYDLAYEQPVLSTDTAGTYRIVVTYTAASL